MSRLPLIALLTDFGENDWFVGTMKGVIKSICPRADIVDITHQIGPQDVKAASMALESSFLYFPEETIFCCVVDPGVGTERTAIVCQNETHRFVAPNNGLLTLVADQSEKFIAYDVTDPKFFLQPVSNTFQGRDVFSPLAAHLASGLALKKMGNVCQEFVSLDFMLAKPIGEYQMRGNVNYIDHFGNLMTNIRKANIAQLSAGPESSWSLQINQQSIRGLSSTFAHKQPGEPLFYFNSADYLEIAINHGRAADVFSAKPDMPVLLQVN